MNAQRRLSLTLAVAAIGITMVNGCRNQGDPSATARAPRIPESAQRQFLGILQQMSPSDRPQYLAAHPDVVNAIVSSNDETAKKQLQSMVSQVRS